jgi:hypothetical protein
MGLSVSKDFGGAEILKVLVVHDNVNRHWSTLFFFFFFFKKKKKIINLLCRAQLQSTGANARLVYKIYMQKKPKVLCM